MTDRTFVLYKVVAKDGGQFRNTEVFRFDGERVREVNVYFGAAYKDGEFVKWIEAAAEAAAKLRSDASASSA